MSRRRRVAWFSAGIVVLIVAANVTGVLRYPGGPLESDETRGFLELEVVPADWG